ncbi:hypothetical protein HDV04_003552 [Boothiomyces sp. JEL0838]|nr:hypothetical protein HDV04_003552 [Boothiomyces sp. JEL0838]
MEIFQRLVEVAGTKEFIPLLSSIQHYVLKLKWAREAPMNVYGGGARPVEINKEEWNELLINGLNSTKKDIVFPIKKRFKTSIPPPEKKVEKKRDRKRATPYSKSKIINAMMDLEKIERVVNPISSPHFAASAGP